MDSKTIQRPGNGRIIVEEKSRDKIIIFPFFGNPNAKIPGIRNTAVVLSYGETKNLLRALKEWDRKN